MEKHPYHNQLAALGLLELLSWVSMVTGAILLGHHHVTLSLALLWCGAVGHIAFRVEIRKLIKRLNEEAK